MLKLSQALFTTLVAALFLLVQCNQVEKQETGNQEVLITVKNTAAIDYKDYLLSVSEAELDFAALSSDAENLMVLAGEEALQMQYSDNTLYILIDKLNAGEEKQLRLLEGSAKRTGSKRTQAEISVKKGGHFENRKYIGGDFENIQTLRVPDEHTDHSYYIRYEGPGWESDLVGYRFYLDWRNAIDIFGKKTTDMVLQGVGLDGFASYHEMQDWGVDVLKVGESLGIGSIGMYAGEKAHRVAETDSIICSASVNGDIYSAIETKYYGWQVAGNKHDLHSTLSIHAGTRLSHHEIDITHQPDNLCTGIVKAENTKLFKENGDETRFGYLASYGVQSLNQDQLGMAVFFAPKDLMAFTEDEFSHIVKLKVKDGKLAYYFLAAWEGEPNGIKTEAEFLELLNQTAIRLANPVSMEIKP